MFVLYKRLLKVWDDQLSGDGKITDQDAFIPGSNLNTRYDFLEIYLVSPQANFTVANSSILSQEPGSTVKHLNWPIPTCVNAGSYNVRGSPIFCTSLLTVGYISADHV